MNKTCAKCRWFDAPEGLCRCRAPVRVWVHQADLQKAAVFPPVTALDWCGDWQEGDEAKAERLQRETEMWARMTERLMSGRPYTFPPIPKGDAA